MKLAFSRKQLISLIFMETDLQSCIGTSKPFPHHDAQWKGMTQLSNIWRSQSKALQKVAGRAWEWRLRWMFPNPKYDLIKRTQRFQTIGLLNPLSRRTGLTKRLQFCEDPKYGLFACIWVRPQSVRPCYLWSDHDFCMHFQHCIFRLVSAKFRQFLGCNRRPYHGLSRSVTAFSDNARDLSI